MFSGSSVELDISFSVSSANSTDARRDILRAGSLRVVLRGLCDIIYVSISVRRQLKGATGVVTERRMNKGTRADPSASNIT